VTVEELLDEIASIREEAEPRTRDALAKFERRLKAFGAQNDRELTARDKQIAEQDAQIAEKDKQIEELERQQESRVTRASPSDIAKSFRAVIDEFHAEAREADDVGVAIKALDLEIKGLVEVEEQQTTLVLPTAGAAVEPTALSTLRVSFATVPVVPAEPPPEPPPEPSPRRRRARS
jgi:predicted RNase H-like nuclease (RuvC/YqgF family)